MRGVVDLFISKVQLYFLKSIMENEFKSGEMRRSKGKKRKNSLMDMTSGGKKGRFGESIYIDGETRKYFVHVLEVKIEDFTSEEDKSIFVDNVFETVNGKEFDVLCNRMGCRVFEKLLPVADVKILLRFTHIFSEDLRFIVLHEFGGFVLQQHFACVVAMIQKYGGSQKEDEEETQPSEDGKDDELDEEETQPSEDGKDDESDEEKDDAKSKSPSPNEIIELKAWVQKVATFAITNVAEFIWHRSANPILRTILECLSGLPLGSTSKGKKRQNKCSIEIESSPMPEGPALVQECGKCMLEYNQIVDCVYESVTSGFLQTLLYALKKVNTNLHLKLVTHLLKKCYNCQGRKGNVQSRKRSEDSLPDVLENEPATRLLDAMIETAGPKAWSQIYTLCFANRITLLSFSSNGNYCLQNLIKQCKQKVEFESIFDETAKNFEQLLSNNRAGIICALAESCLRLSTRQDQFLEELQTALHCSDKKECVIFPILVAYLVNYESWTRNEETKNYINVSLHGSLILQTMLKFPKTIKIVNCLLKVKSKLLERMFSDSHGCFIADAYFGSKGVGDKNREKMVCKLQGSYVALACSKYGSRAFDAIWNGSSVSSRKLIVQELSPKEVVLKSVSWGYFIARNTGLELFSRRPDEWEECQSRETHTRKLFADFF